MRQLRVLLDANVLVDAQVRDLFCRMADAELISLRWSSRILEETRRALTGSLGLDPLKVDRLMAALARTFPEAMLEVHESFVDRIDLPDPDDRHVLAAAMIGECDWIVTENIDDFPDEVVEAFDIFVLTIDDALVLLAGQYRDSIGSVIDRQIAALRRPALTREEFLERLAKRAPIGTVSIGAALEIETYQRIFADTLDAQSDDSPQGAVRELLAALDEEDEVRVAGLVDNLLSARLTGMSDPGPSDLLDALTVALHDVRTTDGWGFATARRPHAPDVELVKLLRAGADPQVVFQPQLARGHLFYLRRHDGGWILVDLDGQDPSLSPS